MGQQAHEIVQQVAFAIACTRKTLDAEEEEEPNKGCSDIYFEWHGRAEKHPMHIANGVEPIIF